MANITLGNGTLHLLTGNMLSSNKYNNMLNSFYGTNYEWNHIKLMSGTMPTDYSTLTSPGALTSQILGVDSGLTTADWDYIYDGSRRTGFTLNMNNYITASATGTVEWFWWYTNTSSSYNGGALGASFIGSVGTSGTDLVIPSTSIISGKRYKITNINLNISQEYTY